MNRKGLEGLLLFSPFLLGLYFPWTAALAVLFLLVLLSGCAGKGKLRVSAGPLLAAAAAVVLFHALGALWGTDRGMALIGALQFLPLPLFVLALEQLEPGERTGLLRKVPVSAACMTLLSLLLSLIPALGPRFLTAGRLSGFFQYPNSFALYLFAGVILLFLGNYPEKQRIPLLLVLLGGIALSRSRGVLGLLFLFLVYIALRKGRKQIRAAAAFLAAALLIGGLWYLRRGGAGFSTFYGRLLYARDALPVIARHPLGLGYLGWYWRQGSFQTGVYTTLHIHNELLQLLADVGWIPAVLCLWALIRSLRKGGERELRLCLAAAICLHSLFDFDLQYPAIAFLLLTALDAEEPGKQLRRKNPAVPVIAGLLAAFSVWLGTAAYLQYSGDAAAAAKLYPGYTTALVQSLPYAEGDEQAELAERVLRLNRSAAPAWNAKAQASFYAGNLEQAVEEKSTALGLSRYDQATYVEYLELLKNCCDISLRRGDRVSAARFLRLMQAVPEMMRETLDGTSALGRKISDRPALKMPEQYRKWIFEKSSLIPTSFVVY